MKKLMLLTVCLLLIPNLVLAELTVYFLDVGQGDCAIIECDGEAMIIDGGLPGQSDKVYAYLHDTLHLSRIQYVVATHPDNDHIGGLPAVFRAVNKVGYLYSAVKEYDSDRFADLQKYANEKKVKITIPYEGQEKYLGNAKVIFYNCGRERKGVVRSIGDRLKAVFARDDPEENKENNDISLVVKIVYGETSFLFAGDIEHDAESRLISSGVDLSADVLKVAHHGSSSSSSFDFLEKVKPGYAVISCGSGNRYGHPNKETLTEFKNRSSTKGKSVELYRTDLQGTITCKSDGHTITFETETTAQGDLFSAPEKK